MVANTNFHEKHLKHGAKMVDFAGFKMPIQYKPGIIAEHKRIRSTVGVFDVSHMGEFKVEGPEALKFVQYISVNDAAKLEVGDAQYSAMCYEDGGIVDDMIVYNMGSDGYMLVVNGANVAKNWDWLMKTAPNFDIKFTNQSDEINLLAVQGPDSLKTLAPHTDIDMSVIAFYKFKEGMMMGEPMIISRTGYTGELGYEIYFRGGKDTAIRIWDTLMKAGESYGIEPVGLGARDTLRLEKGYALYGNDIDKTTNPLEAGLGWITKLSKHDFIGKDAITKAKEEGLKRRLVGFTVEADRFIARQGYEIQNEAGEKIGHVTSGNMSPSLGVPIGMGYVDWGYREAGSKIFISARGKSFPAEVKKMPLL
ncbi:MAG: glycine cleavage system aminomethyltransferase GcvT [Candidatus Kapaibacteriales bacterium]